MINPESIPHFVWAAIAAGAAAFLAPGATFVVTRIFHQMTNSCEAGSCELAAAGVAALSIIPAAAMGFFVTLFLLRRRNGANKRKP